MNGVANSAGFDEANVPPKLAQCPNRRRYLLPLAALVTVAAGTVLFLFDPSQHGFYPICYFHGLTGLLCPGCGSLRAMHRLLHGHIGEAFRCNALLVAGLPFAICLAIRSLVRKDKNQPAVLGVSTAWLWFLLGAAVVFTISRNLPAFSWLAP